MTLDTVCALMIRAKYVLFWKKMASVLPQMMTIAAKNINGVTKPKPSRLSERTVRKMTKIKPCNPRNTKHGAYKRNPTLYGVWNTMKHRCEDKKRTKYKDYGARGIKVCADWQDPNAFIDWALANGYERGLQLDRINNDGNYCPENCRWITPKENS